MSEQRRVGDPVGPGLGGGFGVSHTVTLDIWAGHQQRVGVAGLLRGIAGLKKRCRLQFRSYDWLRTIPDVTMETE